MLWSVAAPAQSSCFRLGWAHSGVSSCVFRAAIPERPESFEFGALAAHLVAGASVPRTLPSLLPSLLPSPLPFPQASRPTPHSHLLHFCVCSVDASACALLSEDYPATTRWHLQRELVACHSQACLVGSAGDTPAASSQQQQQQVVLIAGSGGRASVALHPTTDGSALQQALDGVRPAGEGNLMASLKLALVSPAWPWHCMPFVDIHVHSGH